MKFRFSGAVTLALMLLALGVRPAAAFCVLGYGDSLECRFLAGCEKNPGETRGSCTCEFELVKQTFPLEQLPTVVDTPEATAD